MAPCGQMRVFPHFTHTSRFLKLTQKSMGPHPWFCAKNDSKIKNAHLATRSHVTIWPVLPPKKARARLVLVKLYISPRILLNLTNERSSMITSISNQSQNFLPENFDQRDLFALIQTAPQSVNAPQVKARGAETSNQTPKKI